MAASDAAIDVLADEVRQLQVAYDHHAGAVGKEQLAAAYNNYGVALAQSGQVEAGVAQLRQGLQLAPEQPQLRRNLAELLTQRAQILMAQRKHREAQKLLQEALTYDESAGTWALLGVIHDEAQKFPEAERAWKRALQLDPQISGISERLARLRQERAIEQPFNKLTQVYFNIRYPAGLPASVEYQLREVLEEARHGVGQDLGQYPSQQITVLLYTPEQFHQLRQDTPEWVAGQYDGKVRLPLMTDPASPQFRQIVWHEYTHVVVQELSRGRCPTWLNEGLAEFEGTRQRPSQYPQLRRSLKAGALIPFARLQGDFSAVRSAEEAALAYEQSLSLVTYLVERYGLWRVKRLLKAFGDGASSEDALLKEYRLRPAELERQWLEWAHRSYAS